MKAEVFTSPEYPTTWPKDQITIFLAGSIEQGTAVEWQKSVIDGIQDLPVRIYNPHREHWDAGLQQDITNPVFCEQVEWEMNALESIHTAFFYFQGNTLSPISLAELGMVYGLLGSEHTHLRRAVVVCEPDFWRRGNVQIICKRAGFPILDDLQQGIIYLRRQLQLCITGELA